MFSPHHEVPDQDKDRQGEIGTAEKGWRQSRCRYRFCVRIVHHEVRKPRGNIDQGQISDQQQHQCRVNRRARHDRFQRRPERDHEEGDRCHTQKAGQEQDQDHHNADVPAGFLQPLKAQLQAFQMHDVQERDVGNYRWQEGVFNHLNVGNVHIFNHQECCRTHDGWGQLTVG